MFGIGAGEFIVILIVGLIVFGPSKLPEVGRAIGKGLREFRKAQAALSQTLNEVDISEKKAPQTANLPTQDAVTSEDMMNVTVQSKAVTADDVINLTKEKPIVKESSDDKNFNGNPNMVPAVDAGASVASTGRSSNGTDKQS